MGWPKTLADNFAQRVQNSIDDGTFTTTHGHVSSKIGIRDCLDYIGDNQFGHYVRAYIYGMLYAAYHLSELQEIKDVIDSKQINRIQGGHNSTVTYEIDDVNKIYTNIVSKYDTKYTCGAATVTGDEGTENRLFMVGPDNYAATHGSGDNYSSAQTYTMQRECFFEKLASDPAGIGYSPESYSNSASTTGTIVPMAVNRWLNPINTSTLVEQAYTMETGYAIKYNSSDPDYMFNEAIVFENPYKNYVFDENYTYAIDFHWNIIRNDEFDLNAPDVSWYVNLIGFNKESTMATPTMTVLERMPIDLVGNAVDSNYWPFDSLEESWFVHDGEALTTYFHGQSTTYTHYGILLAGTDQSSYTEPNISIVVSAKAIQSRKV